jgi:hypothetical protein
MSMRSRGTIGDRTKVCEPMAPVAKKGGSSPSKAAKITPRPSGLRAARAPATATSIDTAAALSLAP